MADVTSHRVLEPDWVVTASIGCSGISTKASGYNVAVSVSKFGGGGIVGPAATQAIISKTSFNLRPSENTIWRSIAVRQHKSLAGPWPNNDGFTAKPQRSTLPIGHIIDRYGPLKGRFTSPDNTPFDQRSLPLHFSKLDYTRLEVIKPLPVLYGTARPWFGQRGGGTQYMLNKGINWYVKQGYLKVL